MNTNRDTTAIDRNWIISIILDGIQQKIPMMDIYAAFTRQGIVSARTAERVYSNYRYSIDFKQKGGTFRKFKEEDI